MAEAQQGSVPVGMQFVAHDAVFDDGLLPLVLEHARGIPHQDASGHPLLLDGQWRTRGDHVDHAALAGVDGVSPNHCARSSGSVIADHTTSTE